MDIFKEDTTVKTKTRLDISPTRIASMTILALAGVVGITSFLMAILTAGIQPPPDFRIAAKPQTASLFLETKKIGRVPKNIEIVRSRYADIDKNLLQSAGAQQGMAKSFPSIMVLDLFPDVSLTIVRDKISFRPDGMDFTGHVEGSKDGTVLISEVNNVLAGSIRHERKLYQIRYSPNGSHIISEIDTSLLPEEAPPVVIDESNSFAIDELSFPSSQEAVQDTGDVIDIMVAYTPRVKNEFFGGSSDAVNALIDLAVLETNTAYDNSLVDFQLRLVHTVEVDYNETLPFYDISRDLGYLKEPFDGKMDNVHELREIYGADLVALIEDSNQACGVGYLMTSLTYPFNDEWAFSISKYTCTTGYYSFGHEIGHNMGSHHAVGDGGGAPRGEGLYDYSHGWRFLGNSANQWRTIMAYSPGTRIQYFSNPNVYYDGQPTGRSGLEDNALSLDNVAFTVANYRESIVPINNPPVITVTGSLSVPQGKQVRLNVIATDADNETIPLPLGGFLEDSNGNLKRLPPVVNDRGVMQNPSFTIQSQEHGTTTGLYVDLKAHTATYPVGHQYDIGFAAQDEDGGQTWESVTITITDPPPGGGGCGIITPITPSSSTDMLYFAFLASIPLLTVYGYRKVFVRSVIK